MKTITELFLIQIRCEETRDWLTLETSPNPWPVPGGDADQLVQAGAAYRWTALQSTRPLKLK